MLELLSPAGSMEALRAAVQNGADAVYLGAGGFNARMAARNFSLDDLREAVIYSHVRGVRVHLTLNTLVTDRQMPEAAELIRNAALLGVDAFIVQDLGLAGLCRQIAPDVEVHASTQMSLHSLEGVRAAAELGCSRAVLARELPADQIARICRSSPIEIEVFAHGALCMCYSGQCYLSSVIGRRSGNRGQCAQPCRLPYGYGRFEQRYPLSLKDQCLIGSLHRLEGMGVASLKIEGRMKRPEYVAVVTRIYRAALDGRPIRRSDLEELEKVFSRQGLTDGYLQDRPGPDMLGTRSGERENRELLAAARATYETGEAQRVPVRFYAMVRRGQPAMLAVEDGQGRILKCAGDPPQEAVNRVLTPEELKARLSRTGGTPYYCTGVKAVIDPGLMLPASAVNAMRREVLAKLTAVRGQRPQPALNQYTAPMRFDPPGGAPSMTAAVRSLDQVTERLLAARPAVLYLPLQEIAEHPAQVQALARDVPVAAVLPRVIWDRENDGVLRRLDAAYSAGVRQVLAGNLGQLSLAVSRGFEVRGDFGLNVFNSRTAYTLRRRGFLSMTASFELLLAQVRDLSKALPTELIAYGRLPLMLTENCILKNRTGVCTCKGPATRLVDRTGAEFPVVSDPGTCRSVVLNGKKLYLLDKRSELRNLGLWALRLQFTTENPMEVDRVADAWMHGGAFEPGQHTRGLYLRGVE